MKLLNTCLLCLVFLLGISYNTCVQAVCTTTGVAQTDDNRSAPIIFGTVNLTSIYLQPVGSLLGRAVVLPTDYNYGGASASSVLWECDASDLDKVQFLVATNADDRVGGYWDLGAQDGMPNVYATYFQYVGIRQRMGNVTLSRYWQALPVRKYVTVGDKVQIRLQDLPILYAELYRISQIPANASSNNCGSGDGGTIATGAYTCVQPNAYIQLSGPGLIADSVGQDAAFHMNFWGADNGIAYGMRLGNQLWSEATCVARNVTPLLVFNNITMDALTQGQAVEAQFNISIECSDQAISGTASQQTAIGIQVSDGAYHAAKSLGLVNAENGVAALLSDDYGTVGIAQGVGIFLRNSSSGSDMNFVGQSGLAGNAAEAGWYPVLEGAVANGSSEAGYRHYQQSYSAILKKLEHVPLVAGKVSATAYVLVKLQ